MYFINKHPDIDWNWYAISMNSNITMKIIINNPDKPWNCLRRGPMFEYCASLGVVHAHDKSSDTSFGDIEQESTPAEWDE